MSETMPMKFAGRVLPFAQWPNMDRDIWLEANALSHDLMDEKGATRWSEGSKELFVRNYAMWLAWLKSEGLLTPDQAPGDRFTPVRLVSYLQARRALGIGERTLVNDAVGLRHMFEVLAPDLDLKWLLNLITKLKGTVAPCDKHSNLPAIKELFDLGFKLMMQAETETESSLKQRALKFRNGLAIAMLAARPLMRRKNLAAIRIGTQLTIEGDSDTHFISGMGRPIYPKAFANEISNITEEAFGRRVTVHQFRHAAASSIAKEDPEHVGIVTIMLGHADFRTSERYYIIADENAAFMRYHETLDWLESGGEPPETEPA